MHVDLMRAGIIQDPLQGYNEREYRWIAHEDWNYSTVLCLPNHVLPSARRVVLRFDGLDTVCSVVLNGKTVRCVFVAFLANVFVKWNLFV